MTLVAHEIPLVPPPVVTDSEEAGLLARARTGDTHAFAALYRRHVARVHAVCLRLAGDRRRAEEFTQTAFIQAWHKLGDFRGDSGFSSWLHRLAVNVVLMDFRATRRREARVIGDEDAVAVALHPPLAPPGSRLDLESAIAALPPQARAIFVLHEIEGYTHDEIAALLELQPGTTKAQLHRARHLLQAALQ